tara:strand:+ start:3053 stop:3688 length:636 start_codon:yes stop_codon:yes gene_type:complete
MLYSEIKIIKKITKKKIRGVIHVGAHNGSCINTYARMGIKNIILFEPNSDLVKKIKKKISIFKILNFKIKLENIALGNYNGITTFNINSNDQCSSILNLGLHKEIYKDAVVLKKKKVLIKTLDTFNKREYFNGINFLNIDTQGFELNVLKGAKNILNQIDVIYCEINFDYLYKKNALAHQVDSYLEKFNFKRVYTITPYHPTWGDAIYVKI